MVTRTALISVAMLLALCGSTASAQWIRLHTPGIPRTADGRPDMDAPAPRTAVGTADLSGMWVASPGAYLFNVLRDVDSGDIHESARNVVRRRAAEYGRDDPNLFCLPQGPRQSRSPFGLVKIVQTPTLIVILSEELEYRQIFLDGRALPEDPSPSFMGYSVGRWEGDTLVVESNGFKDRTWLDWGGTPHSEALRTTERITRTSFGRLRLEQTFTDPAVAKRPWTVRTESIFVADTELLEYVCAENERSRPRMVGSLERDQSHAVHVAPEILARYVGEYESVMPHGPVIRVRLTMAGGRLLFEGEPLVPLSATTFTGGAAMRFETDAAGHPTRLFITAVEGEIPARRVSDVR